MLCSSYNNSQAASLVPMFRKCLLVQGHADEEDFEENDVISLISDQEYSMH